LSSQGGRASVSVWLRARRDIVVVARSRIGCGSYGKPGVEIKFTSGGAFHRDVDGRLKRLLADGALVRRAYLTLWFKAAVVLVWLAASYWMLVFVADGPLQALAASVSLGLAAAGIGSRSCMTRTIRPSRGAAG
jgi:hypothetical protein